MKIPIYILKRVEKHPKEMSKQVMKEFGISRQAANKYLKKMVAEKILTESGQTKNKIYRLAPLLEWTHQYSLKPELAEDLIWRKDIRPLLGEMPQNIDRIWHYGFTEMFNNAIDHSGATSITIQIKKTALNTEILIHDNGVGIFKKIQNSLHLLDERHAILELVKGKLTTDPKRHTGEGIFFTSRAFDAYDILSGGIYFSHKLTKVEDWVFENNNFNEGTTVWMKLQNQTSRDLKKIFDQYAPSDEYSFIKTVVPVRLAQYDNDQLISRSQAKRLLSRVDLFKIVVFDFSGVDFIGQAFADEIFRVFASQHPLIELISVNTNLEIKKMIERAKKVNLS